MFATASAVRRGDSRFPVLIEDNFNRPNSSDLGRTPTGFVLWKQWAGAWSVNANRLTGPTGGSPIVVVNARSPDVDVSLDPSESTSIIFRATDANNYLRFAWFYQSSSQTYTETVALDPTVEIVYCNEYKYWCMTAPVRCQEWQTPHHHNRTCSVFTAGGGSCCTKTSHCHYFDDHFDIDYNEPGAVPQTLCGCHGTETHYKSSVIPYPCGENITPRSQTNTYTVTTVTRRLHLERVQGGVATSLGQWNLSANPGRLRVVAEGDSILVLRGGDVTVGEVTSSFNNNATHHGVGRRPGGSQGRTVDNFSLKVL